MPEMYRLTCKEYFESYGDKLKVRITRILSQEMYTYWTSAFNFFILSDFHLSPLTNDEGSGTVGEDTTNALVKEVAKLQNTLKKFYRNEDGTIFESVGMVIQKNATGKSESMTEISPITGTIGSITTPNAKAISESTATGKDIHTTVDDKLKALRETEKNNIIQIFIDSIKPYIYEMNILY